MDDGHRTECAGKVPGDEQEGIPAWAECVMVCLLRSVSKVFGFLYYVNKVMIYYKKEMTGYIFCSILNLFIFEERVGGVLCNISVECYRIE